MAESVDVNDLKVINVKELMSKKSFDVNELADLLGLSTRQVYRLKNREMEPTKTVLILLNLLDKGIYN